MKIRRLRRLTQMGLLLLPLAAHAQTAVLFPLAQMTGTTNDTTLTIRPVNNPIKFGTNIYWLPTAGIQLKTVNGSATTNLIPNDYTVTISGVPGSWRISVNDTNVTLNAAEIGNLTTYTFTDPDAFVKQLIAGPNISLSPANGKGKVTISSTGSGGGSTNVAGDVEGFTTNNTLSAQALLKITNSAVAVTSVASNALQAQITAGGVSALVATNISQSTASNVLNGASGVIQSNGTPSTFQLSTAGTNVVQAIGDVRFEALGAVNTASNSIIQTNMALLAASNAQYQAQFARNDLAASLNDVQTSSVSNTFVDGIAFQPRFGLTKTMLGRTLTGAMSNYNADGFGLNVTNGISLTLPQSLSNVTVVISWRSIKTATNPGFTLFSLGNSTTKSSIEVSDAGGGPAGGNIFVWENYRGAFYAARANVGFTNMVNPLWMAGWSWTLEQNTAGQPKVQAFQRDVNANWRFYRDTIPGKFGVSFNGLTPTFTSNTNATDPFDTLWIGTAGVTNTTTANTGTNADVASVFIFATTNWAAVVEGYRAATLLEDTDTAYISFGDSLLAEFGDQINVPYFLSKKHPKSFYRNYAQNFGFLGDPGINGMWRTNGGFGVITNLPTSKFKHINAIIGAGLNDAYSASNSAATMFTALTNVTIPLAKFGAKNIFVDVPQISTNATGYTYNLATETNTFLFDQQVRTNLNIGLGQYVPRRDYMSQFILDPTGLYSTDGIHPFNRTNLAVQVALADLIDGRPFTLGSNTFNIVYSLGKFTTLTAVSGISFALTYKSDGSPDYAATVTAGGSGTVTSVGLSMPQEFSVANSPVTGAATLTVTRTGDANYNGKSITNAASGVFTNSLTVGGIPVVTTNQLLGTVGLVANSHVKLDAGTNITSTEDATGYTNTVSFTHEGTATNIVIGFNGTIQTFTITNGPDVFFSYAGANGSASYRIRTNVALHFSYQPGWLAGSNNVITNGVLSFSSYNGTNANQIEAAIKENQ